MQSESNRRLECGGMWRMELGNIGWQSVGYQEEEESDYWIKWLVECCTELREELR